jgi:amidophosphoribosyltransferase
MCGIVGVLGTPLASQEVHQALLMLQHRGQDSAGILSVDGPTGKFQLHKELGQVSAVFEKKDLDRLQGTSAIGHTRYSTIGEIREADLQPMALSMPVGIGMVHNGNVSNYKEVREVLLSTQRFFMSDNDLEMILHIMAESYAEANMLSKDLFNNLSASVLRVLQSVEGGYSVIGLLGNQGMFAFRDMHGIRPLVLGHRKREDGSVAYCLTSETCALKFLGYEVDRDLKPGELIWIDQSGKIQTRNLTEKKPLPCMFEWIYFSSADSTQENKNVYEVRLRLGELLGERIQRETNLSKLKFDVVAPVPDTSRPAAIALAETLGVPFREVLIKNRYVQRSFITSGQAKRQLAVGLKFSVIDELVVGKRVLLVDDSIVRGTTSKKIIELLRQRGAKEVYLASTCPPIMHPCFYGIDFPSNKELIANHRTVEEVAECLGADGVFYSQMEDLESALSNMSFCRACLNGEYAYPVRQGRAS